VSTPTFNCPLLAKQSKLVLFSERFTAVQVRRAHFAISIAGALPSCRRTTVIYYCTLFYRYYLIPNTCTRLLMFAFRHRRHAVAAAAAHTQFNDNSAALYDIKERGEKGEWEQRECFTRARHNRKLIFIAAKLMNWQCFRMRLDWWERREDWIRENPKGISSIACRNHTRARSHWRHTLQRHIKFLWCELCRSCKTRQSFEITSASQIKQRKLFSKIVFEK
jgi:hypothetical protein